MGSAVTASEACLELHLYYILVTVGITSVVSVICFMGMYSGEFSFCDASVTPYLGSSMFWLIMLRNFIFVA